MTLKSRLGGLFTASHPTFFGRQRVLRLLLNTVKVAAFYHLFTDYFFVIKPTFGPSMLPTINVRDDWVLLSKLYARGRGIQVGDIVSFYHPMFPGVGAVKRVVGMPGDFVLRDTPGSASDLMIQVPKGHCWVLGDDMGSSRDSRIFGPVPLALVKGRALAKVPFPYLWQWQKFERGLRPVDP
ncbi:MAG: hypothetical protein M1825_001977 [Sarcosagium campestre]|nr:MAG: hypothetical protein M1825_001977 [Sarcosagium campestre]